MQEAHEAVFLVSWALQGQQPVEDAGHRALTQRLSSRVRHPYADGFVDTEGPQDQRGERCRPLRPSQGFVRPPPKQHTHAPHPPRAQASNGPPRQTWLDP
jgi:hypothetical protein